MMERNRKKNNGHERTYYAHGVGGAGEDDGEKKRTAV
jgi:hypothetical protein